MKMTHSPGPFLFVVSDHAKGAADVEEWDREYDTRVSGPGQAATRHCPRAGGSPQYRAQVRASYTGGDTPAPAGLEVGCLHGADPSLGPGGSSAQLRDDVPPAAGPGL